VCRGTEGLVPPPDTRGMGAVGLCEGCEGVVGICEGCEEAVEVVGDVALLGVEGVELSVVTDCFWNWAC
jgi:hypothetical protein